MTQSTISSLSDPTRSTNDPQWIQRLVEGDPLAANKLVERYFEATLRFVHASIPDRHTAEDLTQDVFLSLYASLDRYDPARALEPWIYTIASNKIRDHFRSRRFQEQRRAASIEEGGADHVASEEVGPNAVLEHKESSRSLRVAIDQLSDKVRSTVLLRLDQGLSFAAIADVLGSGEAAVRKRFSRALTSLREALVVEPKPPCPEGMTCA
ncbi:MAG: RNA polymerase sigma factor (sigma-70 family) [Planctomycetota bacterium]|jgi:RNA polymerase sigma factor (sigma-70 family)